MKHKAITTVLAVTAVLGVVQARAQTPAEQRRVPYRLTTESGEPIEMRIYYANNYREVRGVDFDITVPKTDGVHQYRLKSAEGPSIVIDLTVASNKVTAASIAADPQAADQTLSVSSRSGERLMFVFDAQGNNTGITSERVATP